MKRSTTRAGRWAEFGLVLFVALVFWAILAPVYYSSRPVSHRTACLSNVKQHCIALEMYAFDEDERLPLAHSWYTATADYRKNQNLRCYEAIKEHPTALGYAYDSRLHGVSTKKLVEPAKNPMVFESTSLAENTADPFTSLPIPGRHNGNNTVGYVDGHAKSIPMKS